jgi:hypothetical protein
LTESNNDGIRIETGYWVEELTRFAALVAAHEREECAKVAEKRVLLDDNKDKKIGYNHACKVIAESIRARGTR